MGLRSKITRTAILARKAAQELSLLPAAIKDKALAFMAGELLRRRAEVLAANARDLALAQKRRLPEPMLERLTLGDKRIKDMAAGLAELSAMVDPVGDIIRSWRRPNKLVIQKVRVPIGLIAVVYESRPNVTADCIGLCLKSGNSVLLRGGSEAINSNLAICRILKSAAAERGIPEEAINLINTPDRRAVDILLGLAGLIDLVIPRGGESLIRRVSKLSRIPVIKHYKGVCHVYVDKKADLGKAEKICFNAKVQRPGVCNAMESMLVHRGIAAKFLPVMLKKFRDAGVQVRACPLTRRLVKGLSAATDKDYRTEYLGLILSVKVVASLEEAIRHINRYGTRHSDAIVTEDYRASLRFLKEVDSACVYLNASTRFTDGQQFGMGAEIGISTDKLHARGPMGLEELTTYKYMVLGNGQIRQ